MTVINNMVDGDTFDTELGRHRLSVSDTPESVHKDDRRNTEAGKRASEFSKDFVKSGNIQTHDFGTDHFGRKLSTPTKTINGTDIDMQLVLMDQGYTTYQTRFNKAKDPALHDEYKEYFAKNSPYQYGDMRESMSTEDYKEIAQAQVAFTETYNKFKNGDATEEEFDQAIYNLYKDPQKVAHFRHQNAGWNEKIDPMTMGNSDRESIMYAIQSIPNGKELYNKAVRNSHLSQMKQPEAEKTFWEKMDASFSQMNSIANLNDISEMQQARNNDTEYDIPKEQLVQGVDARYHSAILAEADEHGEAAALTYRDQLIEDIDNNKIFDDLAWYAQFGYGAAAVIADPLTLLPAGKVAQGVNAVNKSAKMFQLGNAITGTRMWADSRLFTNSVKAVSWAGAGVVETAIQGFPRLDGDHTYTARDLELDMLMGGAFGTVFGGVIETGSHFRDARLANQKAIREKDEHIDNPDKPKYNSEDNDVVQQEVQNAANSQETVSKWTNPVSATGERVAVEFTPWEAVDKVSKEGYQNAARKIRNLFPEGSPMQRLLNTHLGFNDKKLTPELEEVAQEINSQILHLASVYPDGNVPPAKMREIQGIMYTQKDVQQVNVIGHILEGKASNPIDILTQYIDKLKGMSIFKDVPPVKMKELDLIQKHGSLLSTEPKIGLDEVVDMSQGMMPEQSFLSDVLELNKWMRKNGTPDLREQIEILNGIVDARLNQMTEGAELVQKTKSHGKTVQASGPEIIAQLKKEGLTPKTPEWKARFAQLRKSGVKVSDDVNEVGKLDERVVGTKIDEADPDSIEHFSINDARQQLRDLAKKPNPDEADKILAADLREQIKRADSGEARRTTLAKDNSQEELLPREVSVTDKVNAYKNPTPENLGKLRDKLKAVNKKNGSTVIKGKREKGAQRKRLLQIRKAMKANKVRVMDRLWANGSVQDIVDVIRVSHTLADEAKAAKTAVKQSDNPDVKVEDNPVERPITEEELDNLETGNVTPEEQADIETRVKLAEEGAIDESSERISEGLAEFVRSGEQERLKLAVKPTGVADYIGRMLTRITKGVGEIFVDSKLTSLQYAGAKITELGRGFGGNAKREATAATIRDAEYRGSLTKVMPQYRKAIDAYAQSKGKGAFGRMKARERSADTNTLVDEFNRQVFTVQEMRRQGKPIPKSIDKSVIDFVDQWDYYMEHNHNKLVDANAAGFTKDRKVKHYIPHVWKSGNVRTAISKHGREKVVELLAKGYRNLGTDGNPISDIQAVEQAEKLLDNVLSEDFATMDQFSPTLDTRAKQRRDIDTTAEIDGLSVMDLLDTDVVGIAMKYSNRVGGWIGLSKATKGMIRSQKDIDVFKENINQEALDKGKNAKRYTQMFEDTIDQLFGRPTKNMLSDTKGLPPELRELKDLATLTKMGGLGSAQLIETGQVITRGVYQMFSDPKVAQKVINMGVDGTSNSRLLGEIQSISNITDDLEFLERQTIHLDQTSIDELGKVRKLSTKIANLATGGNLKAEASRGLGKLTGYNAIRRAQTRVTQASFVLDVANHFKFGTGVMGNARMADVGLTDTLGKNDAMKSMFEKHAEFDENNNLVALNVDKWDPAVRDELTYAIARDEAQQIQRTHVGELPPWMNKPIMGLIFQFRQMPIVANSKSLGRALAFADKEAVTGVILNAAIAGLVRYSKFTLLGGAALAIAGQDPSEVKVTDEQTQISKYIAQFGINADLHDLVLGRNGLQSIQTDAGISQTAEDTWRFVQGQVPVAGLMNDYYETMNHGVKGDIEGLVDSAENLIPLSNTAIGELLSNGIRTAYKETE